MALENKSGSITSVLQETRVFPPAPEFARTAHVSSIEEYQALWNRAKDDPEGFWGEKARLRPPQCCKTIVDS
jgi:acetyl-CoA synthetase